jgi:cation diffusion facilitator CzcD-associated flavoprotein CzcO
MVAWARPSTPIADLDRPVKIGKPAAMALTGRGPGVPPSPPRIARALAALPGPVRRRLEARLPATVAPPLAGPAATPRVAIIGTGFGGIGMACRLRQAGIESFTLHDRASAIGGTWRDNSYPGAACDVPSHLYSLSFAPKLDWSRRFPTQPEILGYLESVVDQFELGPHLRLGSELQRATWDEERACWHLEFGDGTHDEAEVLVCATGQLNRPSIPEIPGLERFGGVAFHSARWDHTRDLTDRDIAVIGIGASAIQFVPEVAKVARSVTLFQRSSNYVAPKPDGPFGPLARWALGHVPGLAKLYRFSIWARFEARWAWFRDGSRSAHLIQRTFDRKLRTLVGDRLTERALIPDYPLGCKRILISNDWYPTLLRPNVRVVTEPVEEITPTGVRTGGGEVDVDTIVFGTGFASTGFLQPIEIIGTGGADLHQRWAEGAEAHLGIAVSGFPNLFLLYGPNTNLGHNSIVFMLERQIAYALACIRRLAEHPGGSLDVRPEVEATSTAEVQRRLSRTVWAASCHSWYKTASGKITNNWSGPTLSYWRQTWRPRFADYDERVAPASTGPVAELAGHSGGANRPR